jgi:hypothetical protein
MKTLLTQEANNAIVLNNLAWIYNQKNNPKSGKNWHNTPTN